METSANLEGFEHLELLYDQHDYFIFLDRTNQFIVGQGRSGLPDNDISIPGKAMLDLVIEHEIKKCIFDGRRYKGSISAQNDFFKKVFTPNVIKHGYYATAVVTSSDPFTRFSLNFYLSLAPGKVKRKVFSDMKEAVDWISLL